MQTTDQENTEIKTMEMKQRDRIKIGVIKREIQVEQWARTLIVAEQEIIQGDTVKHKQCRRIKI